MTPTDLQIVRLPPVVEALFVGTIIVTAVWLALVIFIMLRRRASNLTPIQAARKKDVKPGFLTVDHEKQEAMKRAGAAYDSELARREKDEEVEAQAKTETKGADTVMARIARLLSVIMSVFTLATLIGGVIFNVNYLGGMLREYSAVDRLFIVVQEHPIAVAVAVLVIGYHIYSYIAGRKWKSA
jgi:hypothetical protein